MKRTKNSIMQNLPSIESFMAPSAKLPALTAYESAMLNLIYNSDHASHLTLRDGTNHFREMARERGLEGATIIQTAIRDMELVGKELATARTGASGERAVEKALRYVDRRKATLSNAQPVASQQPDPLRRLPGRGLPGPQAPGGRGDRPPLR